MQAYTSKPSQPVTVQAVQYTAPDGLDVAGNVDDIKALVDAREQNPWNPLGGQQSLLVVVDGTVKLLQDGDYLVLGQGAVDVMTVADFTALYDTAVPATED